MSYTDWAHHLSDSRKSDVWKIKKKERLLLKAISKNCFAGDLWIFEHSPLCSIKRNRKISRKKRNVAIKLVKSNALALVLY